MPEIIKPTPLLCCPFCQDGFKTKQIDSNYVGESCSKSNEETNLIQDNHTYRQETLISTNELVEIKLRLGQGNDRNYLKINYIYNVSQVWCGRNRMYDRTQIEEVIKFDITKPTELIKKIRLYVKLS